MRRKVLITGGAGFIGSHTVDELLRKGYQVRVLDNLSKPKHMHGKPKYLPGDVEFVLAEVRDRDALQKALQDVFAVYHFAAYQDYFQDLSTFFDVNVTSTALIYELIVNENLPVEKVIVASSQFVHGEGLYKDQDGNVMTPEMRSNEQLAAGRWDLEDSQGRPLQWLWTGESCANPPNAYAISKYAQELQALKFGRRYNIPSVALRYSIVQGSRQSLYSMYSGACRIFSLNYFLGRRPKIYEDGEQVRDFVNIHDVVDANLRVLEDSRADFQCFCVGGGRPYTVLEFDRVVARIFEREHLQARVPGEYRVGDNRHSCSDISKLKSLGWSPKRSAEDSVREYREYIEAHGNIEDVLEFAEKHMATSSIVRKVSP
jgi:dTDP-L-rhamnose 4-epimerase